MAKDYFSEEVGSIEKDFFSEEVESTPQTGLQKTEAKIAGREDLLGQFDASDPMNFMPNPPKNIMSALQIGGGVLQRGEAAVANAGLAAQRGEPGDIMDEVMQGAKGERLGQVGDLVRTTEVGGPWNEALASTAGFLATMGLDKILTGGKVAKSVSGVAKEGVDDVSKAASNILDPTQQALKDAVTKKTGFLDDVRSAFYDVKSDAVEKYGLGLEKLAADNPTKTITLRPVIDQLSAELAYEPKLRNAINKVPQLAKFMDNPKASNKMTLKEAQTIVNDLQSKVSANKLKGMGVRSDDIPLLDAIHDIKAQMVEAFPDIKELRKGYGETIGAFNMVKNKIKPGNLSGSIKSKFGDVEIEAAAKKLLKDRPDILDRMRNYNGARKLGKVAAIIGGGIAAGAGFNAVKNFIEA